MRPYIAGDISAKPKPVCLAPVSRPRLLRSAIGDTFTPILVTEFRSTRENRAVKRAWAFSCIVALSAMLCGCGKQGSQSDTAASDAAASAAPAQGASGAPASGPQVPGALATVTPAQLPGEAAETLRLIKAGGPYPFADDGVLFRNSAQLLPKHPRGYYHTYTVVTPGSTDRGQRRIVCGGPRKHTDDCYYTDDYYASFKRIEG
jgi:ribonuclease T1